MLCLKQSNSDHLEMTIARSVEVVLLLGAIMSFEMITSSRPVDRTLLGVTATR